MKKLILPAAFVAAFSVSSCIKDELMNTESDIRRAEVHLQQPQDYFDNIADTAAMIHQSYASSNIIFYVKSDANVGLIAPTMTISAGAVMFPQQGIRQDFSKGKVQSYYVIAEDTKHKYPLPTVNTIEDKESFEAVLDKAIANGEHIRKYTVQFVSPRIEKDDVVEYNFSTYGLEPKGRFYEWNDPFCGKLRTVSNWATANEGYSIARSTAKADEYPTVPVANGGAEDNGPYVKLTTCSTGEFGEMTNKPLAAGNLFLGGFDFSMALTQTLKATRFGENNILGRKPVSLSGYYQYTPGKVFTDVNRNVIDKEDRPAIYCVVYLNRDSNGNPVVLDGQTIDEPNNPYIVGRAEIKDWTLSNEKEGWIPFSLGFEWYKPFDKAVMDAKGYNFVVVCSASKDGATYSGAVGSTLLVDNIKLTME